jgi:hypothetical protein
MLLGLEVPAYAPPRLAPAPANPFPGMGGGTRTSCRTLDPVLAYAPDAVHAAAVRNMIATANAVPLGRRITGRGSTVFPRTHFCGRVAAPEVSATCISTLQRIVGSAV